MEHIFITWEVLEHTLFKADLILLQVNRVQTFSASVQVRDMYYGRTSMGGSWVVDLTNSVVVPRQYDLIKLFQGGKIQILTRNNNLWINHYLHRTQMITFSVACIVWRKLNWIKDFSEKFQEVAIFSPIGPSKTGHTHFTRSATIVQSANFQCLGQRLHCLFQPGCQKNAKNAAFQPYGQFLFLCSSPAAHPPALITASMKQPAMIFGLSLL